MVAGKKRQFDVEAWVQFHLLRQASFHPKTTKGDLAVLAEIIQRYRGDKGNGFASHDHLGAMAGVSKATVIRAKKNLELLGFVSVVADGHRGSATVYLPNFGLVPRKGSTSATETLGSTGDTETGDFGSRDDTATGEYGITDATPSYIQVPAYKAVVPVCDVSATPTAPLASGLSADAADVAGFENVWRAYAKFGNKTKSRAAFEAIVDPDIDHIAERASAWAASAKPGQRRMPLEKWLAAEKYDEADRKVTTKLPAKAKGAVRRDAEVDSVGFNGHGGAIIHLRWRDARAGEPLTHELSAGPDRVAQIAIDLEIDSVSEMEQRRVLIDFGKGDDQMWHRHPVQLSAGANHDLKEAA